MTVAGFYGDDFTGSVDALLQFRRAGLSGVLITGPNVDDESADVVGIAGTARSLPTEQMADEVVPSLQRLRELGARIVQYKACSTADSAPHTGSIGRVLELGVELFPGAPVPIVFAQPDAGRYTFFGHHFARDDGVVYRLDRQPTMSSHPVTPVHESDLRLHLSEQTAFELGALHWPSYDDLGRLLDEARQPGVVCDAVSDAQLDCLAQAILASPVRQRFVIGSGGISGALGRCADVPRRLPPLTSEVEEPDGPTLVLNGSRSSLTRRQIDAAAEIGWVVLDLFATGTPERVETALAKGAGVLVDSSITRRTVPSAEVEDELATIADTVLRQQNTRLVLSGGDTSGNVLRRLGIERLRVVAQPWGNVALCQASGPAPHLQNVELVLKGGQMGHVSLFDDIRLGRPLKEAACSPTPVPALTHE
ncbi:four-carbon acid sugar kinase family protein [Kribbella sp. NPDC051586]|uniref:four-carbon acid sugar kinase family protein n=1 Tax=Kribbella sp. NPDC051586 TaxID=3364118 RepID=UPI00379C533D